MLNVGVYIFESVVNFLNLSFSKVITSNEMFCMQSITRIFVVLFEEVPLPLGAWERLRYFIVHSFGLP